MTSSSNESENEKIDDTIDIYDSHDVDDFKEFICELIEEYVNQNTLNYMYPDFVNRIVNETMNEINSSYANISDKINQSDLNDLVYECCHIYLNLISFPRSYSKNISEPLDKKTTLKQIEILRKIPQPPQNTPEWFDFRWNKFTASTAWKAFGTEASVNSLIYSKCKPIDTSKFKSVNIASATHHGHKYEDISIQLYEEMFNTKIEEFGCIADDKHNFIGASPDGINVKKNNNKFGYLLEIKNPVSRKLTGIPKLDYWIQMQQQMYVTKLHYCDFLETIIKEYVNEDEFKKDGTFIKTKNNNIKGIIVCFNDGNGPVYKYPPLQITENKFNKWYDDIIEKNKNLTWTNNTYWYMQEYSCITVPFNKKWFELAILKFKEIWDIILKERKTGYDHRKPKTKKKNIHVGKIESDKTSVLPPKMILEISDNFKNNNI